jgi:hypothetical protein
VSDRTLEKEAVEITTRQNEIYGGVLAFQ